ncbi:hypothetical protein [Euryhalocaulis caribicus]|uniref:hypothetical protein n=1 Tax=Euryhalocaulis caribicus TaxID=1161401 RepID=UPI00039F30E1|nr:hypothetical protein [Euryhalocaulis caribicus]
MNTGSNMRRLLLAGAAVTILAACSDTSISSPGGGTPPAPPPPPPPPATTGDLVFADSCPDGTTLETIDGAVSIDACVLEGNITSDVTLTADAAYAISGPVFVDDGATLTVEAGTVLFGAAGSDYIVVSTGGQIDAQGTASAPIILTSRQDMVNGSDDDIDNSDAVALASDLDAGVNNASGQWGGLVINGLAPINACDGSATGGSADCQKSGEGSSGLFGGDDPNDSSGTLNYVRVQFAGFNINDEDQLNGIAFQGVGAGTEADYLQVINNEDDGVEFFGGTVNVKHVALLGNKDDSFDVTDGWVGNAQYVLIQQSVDAGDRPFELDNNGDDNTALPRSNPTVSNYTVVQNLDSAINSFGILFREGFAGEFYNGVVVGSPAACLDIDQDETFANIGAADGRDLVLQSTLFDCAEPFSDDGNNVDLATFFNSFPNNVIDGNTLQSGYLPGTRERSIGVTDVNAIDPFFDDVDTIGAFSRTETASDNWATGWTIGFFADADEPVTQDCPAGTTDNGEEIDGQKVCSLEGNIGDDLTLAAGPMYELVGPVFVGTDAGADPSSPVAGGNPVTLTIEAGVTVFGAAGSDYLVVTRGSKIRSNGTAEAPVVLTARADVEDTITDRDNAGGLWGGLVINGRAPINACDGAATGGTVDCQKSGEGSSGLFGGASANDDSGSLFYTQVRYAGFNINDEDQLNGIAFQGVGNATDVDFIQVVNNEDDGVEFFGGTVNVSHVVLLGNKDDSFDMTDGWVGGAQYVVIYQNPNAGDRGFEMDNNGDDNTALPRTAPKIVNFTTISNPASAVNTQGMLFREGLAGEFYNGIIVGHPVCVDIDQSETAAQAASGDLVAGSMLLDCPTTFDGDSDGIDEAGIFGGFSNISTATNTLSGFTFRDDLPGLVPGDAEQDVQAVDPATIDAFFDSVDYIGAVENASDDWYQGWTFNPAD